MHTCKLPALVIAGVQAKYTEIVFPGDFEEIKESQMIINAMDMKMNMQRIFVKLALITYSQRQQRTKRENSCLS